MDDQPGRLLPHQMQRDAPSLPLAFELLAEIATGPTARVELCRIRSPKELAGRFVAVKRLHPHIAEDPQFYSMFVDEVWMTAALDHPNITRVIGWGADHEGTYLAVELIEGVSLARLMKTVFETREAFTERMVVYFGSEMCAGLAAAHDLRSPEGEHLLLVHRDLTPGNILIGFDGRIVIADFGLAKAKQRVTRTLTGLLKGHPHYMAPEQATEQPIDGRADLFSLGVLLFELFTGRHPWSGNTEFEVFQAMANEAPADLQSLRPKIDRELASVVHRLLAKSPADRFSSAVEARDRLQFWLETHGYKSDNQDAVARFVRRNAMRQMRWFERAVAGDFLAEATRAKARMLGARARTRGAGLGTATNTNMSAISNMVPPPGPPSAPPPALGGRTQSLPSEAGSFPSRGAGPAAVSSRRRAARRVVDEPTDVQDAPPRISSTPTGEAPDWGEEVPTVVKPNAHHLAHIQQARQAAAEAQAMQGIPSFADDGSDDHRTTAVKPKFALPLLEGVRADREANQALGQQVLQSVMQSTRGVPTVVDSDSGEVETTPARVRPTLEPPPPPPLRKLPPPPPQRRDTPLPPAPRDSTQDGPDVETEVQRSSPARRNPTRAESVRRVDQDGVEAAPRKSARMPRTEADVLAEVDRFSSMSVRLLAQADYAAKVAAHRAVLAQLSSDALHLATQAAQSFHALGAAHAMGLVDEAYRLEASIQRGEANAPQPPLGMEPIVGLFSHQSGLPHSAESAPTHPHRRVGQGQTGQGHTGQGQAGQGQAGQGQQAGQTTLAMPRTQVDVPPSQPPPPPTRGPQHTEVSGSPYADPIAQPLHDALNAQPQQPTRTPSAPPPALDQAPALTGPPTSNIPAHTSVPPSLPPPSGAYTPGPTLERPAGFRLATADSRREATVPSRQLVINPHTFSDKQGLLAGEILGVRVPIALAVAAALALAMVVLVWFIVS